MRQTQSRTGSMRRSVSVPGHNQRADRVGVTATTVQKDEAPSGMMARGKYDAVSKFVDDDGHDHLKFEWSFEIKKDWN